MSHRLKRKLDVSETSQSGSSNGNLLESFVQYGTPLPSLEKKDKNEFVPVWEQTVTDDKGRRRLHGAFTGGFSAGYFNTVGSAEGWTPSNFVSSRNNRAKHAQKASDFMDEEDLADAKEAEMHKLAQEAHQGPSSSATAGPSQHSGSSGAAAGESEDKLVRTIQQSKDRTGAALLKKMGWREGQGVGPRLSAQARSRMARELKLPQEDWSATAAPGQTFAPLDRPLVHFQHKENAYGLGFERGATLHQHQQQQPSSSSITEGGRAMPVGGAFGISALEDADEDDLSVYDAQRPEQAAGSSAKGKASSQSKLARMVQDDQREPDISWRIPNSRADAVHNKRHAPHDSLASKGQHLDGTPTLAGFHLAEDIPKPENWFAPPEVPRGWQPNPKAVMSLGASPSTSSGPPTGRPPPQLDHRGKPIMTADDRAAVLSDEPPKARSVFDFISRKNQERIAAAKSAGLAVTEDTATASSSEPPPPQVVDLVVPSLDKPIAAAALKGFMPYGDDRSKQARYRLFLQAAAGEKEADGVFQPRAQADRVDELNKELQDSKRAAMVFKPMSRAMASRFTSGDSTQTAKDSKMPHSSGLSFVSASTSGDKKDTLGGGGDTPAPTEPQEPEDPAVAAVRAGMFGALTRKTVDFFPCKLLCKRFNCRQPHPDGAAGGRGGDDDDEAGPASRDDSKDLLNKATMEELRTQAGYEPPPMTTSAYSSAGAGAPAAEKDALKPSGTNQPQRSLGSIGMGEDETQGQDILTYERPSMDLFKAIFAEDSEDEGDDEPESNSASALQSQEQLQVQMDVAKPPSASTKANLEPVSFTDFKPTFIRRADGPPEQSLKSSSDASSKIKSKKDGSKKSKKGSTLSFAMDEDDEADAAPTLKRKEHEGSKSKKSKKKAKLAPSQAPTQGAPTAAAAAEEEDEWVEKPQPPRPSASSHAGRAKAADLF